MRLLYYIRALFSAEKPFCKLVIALLLIQSLTAFSQTCDPAPSGLVGWWQGEGNDNDLVGGNNGTSGAGVTFINGKVGKAFHFDGASIVTLNNFPALQLQNFTIEAWVKRDSLSSPTSDALVFTYGQGGYGLGISHNGIPFLSNIGFSATAPTVPSINDTSLHHLAVTKNGSTVIFYVDGIAYSAPTYNTSFGFEHNPALGGRSDDTSSDFFGVIDEVSVYNRVLSAAEIQAIFTAGGNGKCTSGSPVITSQPANQSVSAGDNAAFTVSVAGLGPISYQWKFGAQLIANATNSSLIVGNVQAANSGNYSVIVTNLSGSIASSNAFLAVSPDTCSPPGSGLVAWWQAEGNASDSINGINGTVVSNVTYSSGEVGQAFVLSGTNSGISIPNSPRLQLQNFTIEAWVQVQNLAPPADQEIFGYGDQGYLFGLRSNGTLFLSKVSADLLLASVAITDNFFHHVAVTKNGSSVVFYVDGVSYLASQYNSTFGFGTTLAIGARGDNFNGPFQGEIDEVSVYNRALSATEIQAVYNAGNAGKCIVAQPGITSQPTNVTVPVGGNVTFSVLASGLGPLSYQWRLDVSPIAGATNSILNLQNVQLTDAGNYSVIISNQNGSITSSNASLTVTPDICAPPASGLVGWWPAEGNANDTIGGNNGTVIGTVIYAAGKVGQGFVFNGMGSAISLSNSPTLQLQNFTIEAWVQRQNFNPPADQEIFGYGAHGYTFGLRTDGTLFLSKVTDDLLVSLVAITDSQFHHVAMTKDGANVVFYVDGVGFPASAPYGSTFSFGTGVAIGARGDDFSGNFLGEIDDLAVFGRALLPSEILAIYQANSLGKCMNPSSPVIDGITPSQTVTPGTNTAFTVFAAGTGPFSYLWRFNGNVVVSATNSSFVITNVGAINSGNYQVVVSNSFGSITSAVETLTVMGPPAIIIGPANQTIPQGGAAEFFVDAAGSGVLSYQWQLNGTNLTGLSNYFLFITNVQAINAGDYTVVVSNAFGAVTSAPGVLTVLTPPLITSQPQSQTNYLAGTAYLSVNATTLGNQNLFYQWQFNGTNLSRATNSTLIINNLQSGNAGNYSVVITNSFGKTTSSNALLTIAKPSCQPVPSGLVGWWQGEGATADVISGNLGTIFGQVTYSPGIVGRAYSISGNGAGVLVGNLTNYQLQDFTIDAWIRRSDTNQATLSSGGGLIFTYGEGGYGLGIFDNGQIFLSKIEDSDVVSSSLITDTNWHHVAVTKSGSSVIFYRDGIADPPVLYSRTFTFASSAALGARGDNMNGSFYGLLDEVDLFNRALTPAEVQGIYASTSIGKCPLPLAILSQPTNQLVSAGSNLAFSVAVSGTGPIAYQWFLNGEAIIGATNPTFAVSNATFFQAGSYSVTLSNSFGVISVSNIIVQVQPPVLLVNGSFETGDFAGWVATDISLPLYPLKVRVAGFNPAFGFFLSTPSDGNFCATDGFEGNGPGTISVAQDLFLPSGPASLTFDYRAAWDMENFGGSTLPRTFNVTLQPRGGGTPFQTIIVLTAPAQTAQADTGPLTTNLDLTPYSGRSLRISFDANIPEFYTGPGFFQLDHVVLSYSVLPPLVITRSSNNIIVSWPASVTNFSLQANTNLLLTNGWNSISTNLIVYGPTNTSTIMPLPPTPTFFRLKSP